MAAYRKFSNEQTAGPIGVLWRDPEEFIEVLEAAREPGRARYLLNLEDTSTPEEGADMARRLLAVECSQFLRGANPDTERWLPYVTWANYLDKTDTVVSFNYDRVMEIIGTRKATQFYSVVVPTPDVDATLAHTRQMGCAPVLKLHGSVDWVHRNGKIEQDSSDDLPSRAENGSDLVLAVPGPEKGKFGSRFKEIGSLWRHADQSVQQAARIVFLGYRFPVTDAYARVRFLSAIKFAIKAGKLKAIEIVLGPEDKYGDIARMKGLLSFACGPTIEPTVHPLYVEDFLSFGKPGQ